MTLTHSRARASGFVRVVFTLFLAVLAAAAHAQRAVGPATPLVPVTGEASERTYALNGRVLGPDGQPVAGVRVLAESENQQQFATLSESLGNYRFEALPAGAYRIRVSDPSIQTVSSPLKTSVGSGGSNRADVVLDATPNTGRLVGTLNSPLADQGGFLFGFVSALRDVDGSFEFAGASVVFESGGEFAIDHLVPGAYRVRIDGLILAGPLFGGPVFTEFFDDAATVESAMDVIVPAAGDSAAISINFGPILDRRIAGIVRDESGMAAAGVTLSLLDPEGAGAAVSVASDTDGAFSFDAVTRAGFVLAANDPQDRFSDAFFPGVSAFEDATVIDVTDGDATALEFTLTPLNDTARIQGVVSDSYGLDELAFVQLDALALQAGVWVSRSQASADPVTGAFELGRLPADTYRLRATVFDLILGLSEEVFFDGAATIDGATDIVLGDGEVIDGIQFALGPPAQFGISGVVTDDLGVPIAGVAVSALELPLSQPRATVATNADGVYTLAPLAPGAFAVQFSDPSGAFDTEFFPDADTIGSAVPVEITDANIE
ncbi:MAG: carboxypeptidase-like regulatory domain-containing protein, partial [Pseudomonadota bacterium]